MNSICTAEAIPDTALRSSKIDFQTKFPASFDIPTTCSPIGNTVDNSPSGSNYLLNDLTGSAHPKLFPTDESSLDGFSYQLNELAGPGKDNTCICPAEAGNDATHTLIRPVLQINSVVPTDLDGPSWTYYHQAQTSFPQVNMHQVYVLPKQVNSLHPT